MQVLMKVDLYENRVLCYIDESHVLVLWCWMWYDAAACLLNCLLGLSGYSLSANAFLVLCNLLAAIIYLI